MAQLTPFEVGQVKAHMHHDLGARRIAAIVRRADGTHFSDTAIQDCINKLRENKRWRGEREAGSGAERKTSAAEDKQMVKFFDADFQKIYRT